MFKDTPKSTRSVVIAATAVFALSGAIYEQENMLPKHYYNLPDNATGSYSNVLNFENINKINLNTPNQIETLNNFIKSLSVNSKDLDPEIVNIVNDNIFDLI